MKYPKFTKLRKPYQTTILCPPDFSDLVTVWIIGKVWYKKQYESAYSKLVARLLNGKCIEIS